MFKVLLSCLMTLSLTAHATTYSWENSTGDKLQEITQACDDQMTFMGEKDLCKTLAPYLSINKVSICSKFSSFSDDRIECLKAAASGTSPNTISMCSQKTFSDEKIECLKLGDSAVVIEICDSSFTFSSEKDLCKQLAPQLTLKKVLTCSGFSSFSEDKEACLNAGADGVSNKFLQFCSTKSFSSDKQECLKNSPHSNVWLEF